jgi:hypothetical protein
MDSLSADSDHLTWTNVAIGLTFILFDVGVSTILRLGVGVSLLVAALRCIGQLAVVATVLQGVFEHKNPWSVAGIACESDSFLIVENDPDGEQSRIKFVRHYRDWYAACIHIFSIFEMFVSCKQGSSQIRLHGTLFFYPITL